MSQKEFLEELRTALSGKLSAQAVLENIEYYRNYIEGEVRSGKSEAQVLEMLGDPWILARTISDAQDGTDDSIVNEAGGSDYGAYGEETGRQDMHFSGIEISVVEDRADHSGCDPWNCSGYFCDHGAHQTSAPGSCSNSDRVSDRAVFKGKR